MARMDEAGLRLRAHKYNAKRAIVDGISFPSKAEAARYCTLKLLKAGGAILAFECQVTFLLHAGIKYKADFVVTKLDGTKEVEDVKGYATAEFKLKMKLFNADYAHIYGPLKVIS